MLVASYHPLTQMWTLRTGQTEYRGYVANLEQRTRKFFSNFPPSAVRPPDSTRPGETQEGRVGERRRAPFVVNRHMLEAAFRRLLASRRDYNGG